MAGLHSLEDAELVGEHLAEMFFAFKNYSTSKKIGFLSVLGFFIVGPIIYYYNLEK